ncbi:glycogen debranching N-terminal domain-containing protein [Actinoplanes sp. NEAU-A12]|uniref:Glycogen debranching N-terminal domain-containing protein n=1 Tax=Actinoplanes sandaracinus TaxID=3045177 RepID=A0ABT6WGI1_9ACTN|nr:glycogen debranching N-terminal domain-containing protein [Actinoplanes sandaracinus]MDI6098810.1 glycogen debranching N-terminal domain-containing protein [Actinoplanes sandaracinus]
MSGHSVVAGTTCLLTAGAGADVTGSSTDGFFVDDCRHLSRLVLRVPGPPLRVLRGDPGSTVYAPDTGRHADAPYAMVRRRRVLPGRLIESLELTSFITTPQTIDLGYELAADFADQFELRSARTFDKSDAIRGVDSSGGRLIWSYARRGFTRATTVDPVPAAELTGDGLRWSVPLPPRESVTLEVTVSASPPADPAGPATAGRVPAVARDDLARCVRQGLADLDALSMPAPGVPGAVVPAAGAPWFLTVFGRDSLLTSLFAVHHRPGLAAGTLRALAAAQGRVTDESRVEEPGKIIHETRRGELATTGEVPYGRYYGSVDATPLFLMLLAAYHEVTGDDRLAGELERAARAAVGWMLGPGGLTSGYLRYRTDLPGLVHHCWKDSADSIVFADGTPAAGPIAVAEAQAYAYRGLLGAARLAARVWDDPAWSATLTATAAALRDRFAADFRLPDGFVALALDAHGAAVDAPASNAGHVLWCGLLDDDWAATVAGRLARDDFFSGWGVRTLAAGQVPYHPLSYHRGGVWPHDTAITVAGLAAAGHRAEAAAIADGLLAAASYTEGRLPEVMTGLARERGCGPVPYPHSCSPQAWAAAAPLLLLTL